MVNIYLASGSKAPRRIHRTNYYILEVDTSAGLATAGGFCSCDDTKNGAAVKTLQAAAARLRRPADVIIYTDNTYIYGIIQELKELKAAGFLKKSGEAIAYAEEWSEIAGKFKSAAVTMKPHSYYEWMKTEIKKRG